MQPRAEHCPADGGGEGLQDEARLLADHDRASQEGRRAIDLGMGVSESMAAAARNVARYLAGEPPHGIQDPADYEPSS